MSKSAFIAIVGRPSAGKSTLLNALCGQKISIVSPVPQTTRNSVRGILQGDDGQIVFIDTPGFHNSNKQFNKRLSALVHGSLSDAELALYVIDPLRPLGEEEELLAQALAKSKLPVIAVCNKIDGASKVEVLETRTWLSKHLPEAEILEVSALAKTGLDELKSRLFQKAPEGQAWYPKEYYTDQDPEFRVSEIIREQVMNLTRDEIPHAAYVRVDELSRSWPDGSSLGEDYDIQEAWDLPASKKPRLKIQASILIERETQKGILIGKGGELIGKIRKQAEESLREIFPYFIDLELRVKVDPSWRTNEKLIKDLLH